VIIAVGSLLFLGIAGLLIWWGVTFWWFAKPVAVVLLGCGHETDLALPHNSYGCAALADVADAAKVNDQLHIHFQKFNNASTADFDDAFKNLRQTTVLIVLAMHGGADEKGAYLLPQDADPRDPAKRLYLSHVLHRLAELDAATNKILVLDATQVTAHWPLGMVRNDFVPALRQDLQKTPVSNLVALCASSDGQRSWVSPEWRQSVFLHYIAEGLKGAVGGDVRLTALELHQYAARQVESWARENRGERQTPVLLPQDGGAERAERIGVGRVLGGYQEPAPPAANSAFKTLEMAWQRWHELHRSTALPPGFTYAPQLWREYTAALLRSEELERSGAKDRARDMLARAEDLRKRVEGLRQLNRPMESDGLALPLAAAVGQATIWPDGVNRVSKVWAAATPEKRQQFWDELEKELTDDRRTRLAGLILDKALKDENLDHAYDVAEPLCRGATLPPVELHFLRMLVRRDLPSPRPNQRLLRLAVATRRLAEQAALGFAADAYPYAEQLHPWIKDLVQQADQRRRLAEDRLFCTQENEWAAAEAEFTAASEDYKEIAQRSRIVRMALQTRDEVLADLPYYSQWLAAHRPDDGAAAMPPDAELWARAHELAAVLDQSPDARQLAKLSDLAKQVRDSFTAARTAFQAHAQAQSAKKDVVVQGQWHQDAAALTVPWLDLETRQQLWQYERSISSQLLQRARTAAAPVPTVDEQQRDKDRAAAEADRQGRAAAAMWNDSLFPDAPRGSDLGSAIGRRWRTLISTMQTRTQHGLRPETGLAEAAADCAAAARMARLADGAAAQALEDWQPADKLRRLQLHDWLLAQGERTRLDFWAAEGATPATARQEHYYFRAGLQLAEDAWAMIDWQVKDDPRRQRVAALEEALNQSAKLLPACPSDQHITSERQFAMTFHLQSEHGVPPGLAVLGVQVKNADWLTNLDNIPRRLWDMKKDQSAVAVFGHVKRKAWEAAPPAVPEPEQTQADWTGWFRGHVVQKATRLWLHPTPDVVAFHQPPPPAGGLTVRAEKAILERFAESNGQLVLILDCSGSMNFPFEAKDRPKMGRRFDMAVQALDEVLAGLPNGVTVSLLIYGDEHQKQVIEHLLPPIRWTADLRGDLMKRVRELTPYWYTPLIRSMWEAKKDFAIGVGGFKTMVVLTDGRDEGDDAFDKDKTLNDNGKLTIGQFLEREFKDTDIQINVVGFEMDETDLTACQEHFAVFPKLPIPGRFLPIRKVEDDKKVEELARTLRQVMRPTLRYAVDAAAGDGRPVSGIPSPYYDWWWLKPARHEVALRGVAGNRQSAGVDAGDLLLVDVFQDRRELRFRRGLVLGELIPCTNETKGQLWDDRGQWRIGLMTDRLAANATNLNLHLLLENREREPARTVLSQKKPQLTWLELNPTTQPSQRVAVRWGDLAGVPAPAWSLEARQWPHPLDKPEELQPVQVRAWWCDQEAPLPAATMDATAYFGQTTRDGSPVGTLTTPDGEKIYVDSVRLEDHPILTRADRKEAEIVPCLVLRLRHAKGQPLFVTPVGTLDHPLGYEQHLYRIGPNEYTYTGLLWPVNSDEIARLRSFNVHLLDTFKKSALSGELTWQAGGIATKPWPDTALRALFQARFDGK
jgi:hypothetical protein